MKFCLRTLSPIHLGCDEVYEPMSFVVDEENKRVTVFDAMDFMKTLNEKEKRLLMEISRKGTATSILELYRFMRNRRLPGSQVEVCPGFVDHYRDTLAIPLNDSRRVQSQLTEFAISRTAFNPSDGRPYIPGSAIKGALRTAYLNSRAARMKVSTPGGKGAAQKLEEKLLNTYNFETSPFRFLKVSDFMPVGEVKTRILYAVNRKKIPSKHEARGPYQILEIIEPGALFVGVISIAKPEKGAGIGVPLSYEAVVQSAQNFFSKERARENGSLNAIGCPSLTLQTPEKAFELRIGRHSGAECLTIEGHRSIKIMQGNNEPDKFEGQSTTLWLASDSAKPAGNSGLKPFGWGIMGPVSREMDLDCGRREKDYIAQQASRAQEQRDAWAALSRQAGEETEDKNPAPVRETWDDASLTYSANDQMVTAVFGGKKATCKGKEHVPECFHEKLFGQKKKKKPVITVVEVEQVGNAFKIVSIKESSNT
jgi:CRISPR-associated protein Csm5